MRNNRIKVEHGGTVRVEESMVHAAVAFLQVGGYNGDIAEVWLTPKETKKLIKALKATLKTEED